MSLISIIFVKDSEYHAHGVLHVNSRSGSKMNCYRSNALMSCVQYIGNAIIPTTTQLRCSHTNKASDIGVINCFIGESVSPWSYCKCICYFLWIFILLTLYNLNILRCIYVIHVQTIFVGYIFGYESTIKHTS